MKALLTVLFFVAAGGRLIADKVDEAVIAAMNLGEKPNYAWYCTIVDDVKTYEIEGKTQRGGYTWQRQPLPNTIVRRLGQDAERELEAIFLGASHCVIKTTEGWKSLNELPKRHRDWDDEVDWDHTFTARRAKRPADGLESQAFGLPPAIYLPVLRKANDDDRLYSNAQFALALPHEELEVIVSSHSSFHVEGDTVSGSLTEVGAQLLLVRDGQKHLKPVLADGRFKLWMANGAVSKYEVELAGILLVAKRPIYVRQKLFTVVKDIGTTKFSVPSEVRMRFGK